MGRYIIAFAVSALLAGPALLVVTLLLAPAPVAAEYWVRQMHVVKMHAARAERSAKGLVVAGSSGLFAIDAEKLTRELGVPFVNLSLHAALPLDVQLEEAESASLPGDAIVLALEASYYECPAPNPWFTRNMIAWMPERWDRLTLPEKSRAVAALGPFFTLEVVRAGVARLVWPAALRPRLEALDDGLTLARFRSRSPPRAFAYSPLNLDARGDLLRTEGGPYEGPEGPHAEAQTPLCGSSGEMLRRFAARQAVRGVATFIASAPFLSVGPIDRARIVAGSRSLERDLATIAPLLDTRADVTYGREAFFDAANHLNAGAREIRTGALARALQASPEGAAWMGRAKQPR